MRLKSIRILNYKGFADSGPIALGNNWTAVVGRNNAGKTALLECFEFHNFSNKPHRNISQALGAPLAPESRVEISLSISGKELERALLVWGNEVSIPVPDSDRTETFIQAKFFGTSNHTFTIYKTGGVDWRANQYPSHDLFQSSGGGHIYSYLGGLTTDQQSLSLRGPHQNANDSVPSLVGHAIASSSYVFRAERRVSGTSGMQDHLSLAPDASNLPGALNYLYTSNPVQFERLLKLVRQVLPDIQMITIPPVGGNVVQIKIWNCGYQEERSDLAIPLEECGTGIGQVLAILFVAVTAVSGRIIVIDEPNSFLHPGASRVLMQLLRDFHDHQFIITTHSPEIIAATDPDKLIVVQWLENQSRAMAHDGAAIAGMRTALDELGVRLSDVFGYDAIAWVEGPNRSKVLPANPRSCCAKNAGANSVRRRSKYRRFRRTECRHDLASIQAAS
jgi:hypothetical protein